MQLNVTRRNMLVWVLMTLGIVLFVTLPLRAFGGTVVYPTGDPTRDVAAVRAAVRAGGMVFLKATDRFGTPRAFDFGDYPVGAIDWDEEGSGYVALGTHGTTLPVSVQDWTFYLSVGNDVWLRGETRGSHTTTIRGGTSPVRNFELLTVPGAGEQIVYGLGNIVIEGIRFTESALQSIYTTQLSSLAEVRDLVRARGLKPSISIRGNEFHDIQPAYSFYWYALAAVTDGPAGSVEVRDNRVRFSSGRWDAEERAYEAGNGLDPASELWEGISIANLHRRGDIAGNVISGVDLGILVYFAGSDFVRISRNRVKLRPDGIVGISAQANHRYLIEGNTVIAPGSNPDGVYLWASDGEVGINDSVVAGNLVVMDGSDWGAITLFGHGSRNLFAGNRVERSGAYALGLVADFYVPELEATENRFVGNDISRFTPRDSSVYGPGVHVFFDANTRFNRFVGWSGVVNDLGQDNVFVNHGPGRDHRR